MESRGRERGFTAIEMAVVAFIFLAAAALVFQVAQSLATSYRTGEAKIQVEENLRAGMTTVLGDLRESREGSYLLRYQGADKWPSGDTLIFEVPQDMDGNGSVLNGATGDVEFGLPITIEYDARNRQILRKQDLNKNGIAEANVPGEIRVVCNNVKDLEFYFPSATMNEIRVTMTVEKRLGQDAISHTLRETVVPRN
jgi:hypothetical protein